MDKNEIESKVYKALDIKRKLTKAVKLKENYKRIAKENNLKIVIPI